MNIWVWIFFLLGIPCPPEALRRLMNTLPKDDENRICDRDNSLTNPTESSNACSSDNHIPVNGGDDEGYSADGSS